MGSPNITPFGQEKKADESASPRAACPPGCQKIPDVPAAAATSEKFQGIDYSDSFQPIHYSPGGRLYKRRTSRGHAETKMRTTDSQKKWFWILIVIILVLGGYWAWKKNQS